jgi:hypothetical protein
VEEAAAVGDSLVESLVVVLLKCRCYRASQHTLLIHCSSAATRLKDPAVDDDREFDPQRGYVYDDYKKSRKGRSKGSKSISTTPSASRKPYNVPPPTGRAINANAPARPLAAGTEFMAAVIENQRRRLEDGTLHDPQSTQAVGQEQSRITTGGSAQALKHLPSTTDNVPTAAKVAQRADGISHVVSRTELDKFSHSPDGLTEGKLSNTTLSGFSPSDQSVYKSDGGAAITGLGISGITIPAAENVNQSDAAQTAPADLIDFDDSGSDLTPSLVASTRNERIVIDKADYELLKLLKQLAAAGQMDALQELLQPQSSRARNQDSSNPAQADTKAQPKSVQQGTTAQKKVPSSTIGDAPTGGHQTKSIFGHEDHTSTKSGQATQTTPSLLTSRWATSESDGPSTGRGASIWGKELPQEQSANIMKTDNRAVTDGNFKRSSLSAALRFGNVERHDSSEILLDYGNVKKPFSPSKPAEQGFKLLSGNMLPQARAAPKPSDSRSTVSDDSFTTASDGESHKAPARVDGRSNASAMLLRETKTLLSPLQPTKKDGTSTAVSQKAMSGPIPNAPVGPRLGMAGSKWATGGRSAMDQNKENNKDVMTPLVPTMGLGKSKWATDDTSDPEVSKMEASFSSLTLEKESFSKTNARQKAATSNDLAGSKWSTEASGPKVAGTGVKRETLPLYQHPAARNNPFELETIRPETTSQIGQAQGERGLRFSSSRTESCAQPIQSGAFSRTRNAVQPFERPPSPIVSETTESTGSLLGDSRNVKQSTNWPAYSGLNSSKYASRAAAGTTAEVGRSFWNEKGRKQYQTPGPGYDWLMAEEKAKKEAEKAADEDKKNFMDNVLNKLKKSK